MFTLYIEVLKLIEKYARIKAGARNAKNIAVGGAAVGVPSFSCFVFRSLKARNATTKMAGAVIVAAAIAIEIVAKDPATNAALLETALLDQALRDLQYGLRRHSVRVVIPLRSILEILREL